MEKMTLAQVQTVVKTMAQVAFDNEAYFSELDGVMGDADFGVTLATGFKNVMACWDSYNMDSIGDFLLGVMKALTGTTGGCSGAVWGTLFMRTGMAFKGKTEISLEEITAGLESAIDGISKRGGAVLGDKTLLDVLQDIVDSYKESIAAGNMTLNEAIDAAAVKAVECKERTKGWVAKRGRQFFTGDRSIGTYDPGIVAIGVMSDAIAKALK